ncbi:MAG TPA: COQ9 family protein [Reyranella sp.]|jgi:ubiquinone biosynthesis protein COQ9|nr:COQ9 family protein [Reyranella sp.]
MTESDPDAELRDRLADAVAQEAAFSGWTSLAIRNAGERIGAAADARRLFPGGPVDVLAYLSRRADERTVEALDREGGDLRTRERVALGVKLRIQNTVGGKESVRRGLALLATPFNGPLALKLLYRTVDAIWYAAGDTSTDFNFYSKRALLSGVFSSTLLYWLNDRSPDDEATWAFLDRRIADVMRFEKLKADVTSWTGPRRATHR